FNNAFTITGSTVTRTFMALVTLDTTGAYTNVYVGSGECELSLKMPLPGPPPPPIIKTLIYFGSGNDVTNLEGTAADTSLTILGGAGQNTVNLSPTAQFLDGLQGPVTINGGTGRSGATTLNVFDQNDPFGGDTYTVTNQSVTRTAAALITFTNVPN